MSRHGTYSEECLLHEHAEKDQQVDKVTFLHKENSHINPFVKY